MVSAGAFNGFAAGLVVIETGKKAPASDERRRADAPDPATAATPVRRAAVRSDARYVRSVESLVAGLNFELNNLSLGEGFETIHLDRGEVNENVFARLLFNEPVPLGVIEPFDLPSRHDPVPPAR